MSAERPSLARFEDDVIFELTLMDAPDLVDLVAEQVEPDNDPCEWDRLHEFATWLTGDADTRMWPREAVALSVLRDWLVTILPDSYIQERALERSADWTPDDEEDPD